MKLRSQWIGAAVRGSAKPENLPYLLLAVLAAVSLMARLCLIVR